MKALFIWLLVITAFCVASQNAYAQAKPRVAFPPTTTGNRTTLGPTTADAANAATWSFGAAANGEIFGSSDGTVPTAGGKSIPITATGRVNKPSAGKALAKFGARMAGPLAAGMHFYELLNDLGLLTEREGEINRFYTLDSYEYQHWRRGDQFGHVNPTGPLYTSPAQACSPTGSATICTNDGWEYTCSSVLGPSPEGKPNMRQCITTFTPNGHNNHIAPQVRDHAVGQGEITGQTKEYVSEEELANRIAAESGWPSDSPIFEALKDAAAAGSPFNVEQPYSTVGPSTAPASSPTVTVTEKPISDEVVGNERVRTREHLETKKETETSLDYGPNSITQTDKTVQTTSRRIITERTPLDENGQPNAPPVVQTGSPEVIERTETTESPDIDEQAIDTPFGAVPDLYKQRYPNGLTGVWNARKAQLNTSPLLSLVGQLMPTIAPGGTCPQWMLHVDLGIADFGLHNVSPPCTLWPILAAIIIVSALLLARRLIFGG